MLADDSYDSYGIEIVRSAWQDAEKIRRTNNLERLTNICGDVNRELPFLAERYAGKNVTVVVDPPRKGLDEKTRRTLIELNPRTLIYVSCDSATLHATRLISFPRVFLSTLSALTICSPTPNTSRR